MKKRLFPLVLAASLLLSTPALAVTGSMENFVRSRTYEGQFSDLAEDSVFYDNVSALYEYGLSNGRPDGTYGLQAPMTVGEICIFAGRIRSLYRTGDPEAGPKKYITSGEPLSAGYLDYLKAEGVVGSEISVKYPNPGRVAPRWEAAHLLANVLPKNELPQINKDVAQSHYFAGYIPDLENGTPYYSEIFRLYEAGITAGSDDKGSFHPDEPITRGAAAAMLTRLVDPSLRKTLNWEVPAEKPGQKPAQVPGNTPGQTPGQTPAQNPGNTPSQDPGQTSGGEENIPAGTLPDRPSGGITYASLVEPGAYIPAPATGTEMDQAIRYMIASDTNKLTLNYGALSAVRARSVMNAALQVAKTYCEQSYNSVTCSFTEQGSITLTFTAGDAGTDETNRYRQAALEAALEVQSRLRAEGKLRDDMTERERAEVCYTWVCESCEYDDTAGDSSLSHIPYSLFTRGVAVCDGYTGAYNLLLKLEGIQCMALANEDHIWTVAELDGTLVHIDTTWGDTVGSVPDYRYFAMTPEQSWGQHKW